VRFGFNPAAARHRQDGIMDNRLMSMMQVLPRVTNMDARADRAFLQSETPATQLRIWLTRQRQEPRSDPG